MHGGAIAANFLKVDLVIRIVNECTEVDAVLFCQMPEQIERAHLVTLIGWVGQTVHQIKNVCHADQPRFRTMKGPRKFASARGMRRQAAIISLYLGLLGLFRGMPALV